MPFLACGKARPTKTASASQNLSVTPSSSATANSSAPGRNKQLGVYCSFHAEKRLLSVSIKTVTCPDCKLVVPVTGTDPDFRFVSDVTDWKRLCERPHRGDPVGSLLWRLRTNLRRKE